MGNDADIFFAASSSNTGILESSWNSCCSHCGSWPFCSPVSGNCYPNMAKNYYQSCSQQPVGGQQSPGAQQPGWQQPQMPQQPARMQPPVAQQPGQMQPPMTQQPGWQQPAGPPVQPPMTQQPGWQQPSVPQQPGWQQPSGPQQPAPMCMPANVQRRRRDSSCACRRRNGRSSTGLYECVGSSLNFR